ncbi:hypothetical protein KC19_VG262400 [Ceratodon purpureus]|uniref:ribonuclease H n=1 Tax=Ceratodon purpureus TaxID=3225 RepID=A0A8T0HTT0_CERPU|nr:hypothetical protein KC19_VG262400 [Ceratodon purpureus]
MELGCLVLVLLRAALMSYLVRVVSPLALTDHVVLVPLFFIVLDQFRRNDIVPTVRRHERFDGLPIPIQPQCEGTGSSPLIHHRPDSSAHLCEPGNGVRQIKKIRNSAWKSPLLRTQTVDLAGVKYYAVARGISPGIYTTWDECSRQVVGVRGAVHKSFSTIQKAEEYIRQNRCP